LRSHTPETMEIPQAWSFMSEYLSVIHLDPWPTSIALDLS
jgi:hypothetical protein